MLSDDIAVLGGSQAGPQIGHALLVALEEGLVQFHSTYTCTAPYGRLCQLNRKLERYRTIQSLHGNDDAIHCLR